MFVRPKASIDVWGLFLALAALGFLSDSAGAAILSFQEGVSPTPDYVAGSTTIRSDSPNTPQDNDPDHENILGRVGSNFMRGLWEFDVSALGAQGGYVQTVDLNMTTRGVETFGPITVNLFQYDFPFAESSATWNDPDGDGSSATGDTTPGGSLGRYLTSVRLSPTPADVGVTLPSTPAFRQAVNEALSSPDQTLRLIARRDVESGSGNHFVRLYDETRTPSADRPELVVTTGESPMPTVLILDDGSEDVVNPNVTLSDSDTWEYRPESGGEFKPNSYNGTGSRFADADPASTATYTPDLPSAGEYQVALWWPTFDWAEDTKVLINHAGGTTEFEVNQSVNSGQWNALGVFDFEAGTLGSVVISSEDTTAGTSGVGPVADAVRFVLDPQFPLVPAGAFASTSHPINDNRPPTNVTDGSGMRDLDDDPVFDAHEANEYGDSISWMSDSLSVDTDPWFAIDLGENVPFLDKMEVFNFNAEDGRTDRGVGQADIYISTLDDVGIDQEVGSTPDFSNSAVWQLLAEDVTFNEATGLDDYATPDVIDLGQITARWIALDIDGSLGGAFVGLSEIQVFQRVPEPSSAVLAVIGLAGLGLVGLRSRRRRR